MQASCSFSHHLCPFLALSGYRSQPNAAATSKRAYCEVAGPEWPQLCAMEKKSGLSPTQAFESTLVHICITPCAVSLFTLLPHTCFCFGSKIPVSLKSALGPRPLLQSHVCPCTEISWKGNSFIFRKPLTIDWVTANFKEIQHMLSPTYTTAWVGQTQGSASENYRSGVSCRGAWKQVENALNRYRREECYKRRDSRCCRCLQQKGLT